MGSGYEDVDIGVDSKDLNPGGPSGSSRQAEKSPQSLVPDPTSLQNTFSLRFMRPAVKVSIRETAPFHIPYEYLASSSEYFRRCLDARSGFKESLESAVKLDLDEEYFEPFGHYVQFMHEGKYTFDGEVAPSMPIPSEAAEVEKLATDCTRQAFLHARVYILGEHICADGLKEFALGRFARTLYVAYRYPQPDMYSQSWPPRKAWQYISPENWEIYREFCHKNPLPEEAGGGCALTQSLVPLHLLKDLARLVYENIPESAAMVGIGGVIARYCASIVEDFRENADLEELVDIICENKGLIRGLIMLLNNAETLTI